MKKLFAFWISLTLAISLTACSGNTDHSPSGSNSDVSLSLASVSASEPEAPSLTSLTLDCDQAIQLDVKETQSIPVLVLEEGADTSELEFTSSAPEVLTFAPQDENGALVGVATPKAEGTAEISVSAGDVKSQTVTVTVIDSERIAAEQAAQQAAEEEAAQQAAQEPQEEMVWIPKSGSKYHSDPSCSGMNNPTQVPISTAKAKGYEPCKRCY